MNILKVAQIIESEESARSYWRCLREKQGITCKNCGCNEHHWLKVKQQWSCNSCDFRTTLRSGTIMENSKLPFRYWIYAIYLMLNTKKGISALALQRQLEAKRYEPIWFMCHKIRLSMGLRDQRYFLTGSVEMDECFVTVMENIEDRPDKKEREDPPQLSRGRGSERKEPVAVMASFGTNKLENKRFLKAIKMQVLMDCGSKSISEMVSQNIDKDSSLYTDGHASYRKLGSVIKRHIAIVSPATKASKTLPAVHLAISNLKRQLLGMHHCVSRAYLQCYLNEFCYKTSRQWAGLALFERFMDTCAQTRWYGCG